jgi:hypothetical protein
VQIIDYITLVLLVLFAVVGLITGFGSGLKFFTSGVFGIIIAIVVCIALVPSICGLPFVVNLFAGMNENLSNVGDFGDILVVVVDYAIVGVILFIVVQLLRILIVNIIAHIVEVDNIIFKILNKTLGVVFYVAVLFLLILLIFSIISLIGGNTATNVATWLKGGENGTGSIFKIDELYRIVSETVTKVLNGTTGA